MNDENFLALQTFRIGYLNDRVRGVSVFGPDLLANGVRFDGILYETVDKEKVLKFICAKFKSKVIEIEKNQTLLTDTLFP